MLPPRTTGSGILLIVVATLLFAVMDGISRHVSQTYPVVQIIWVRHLVFLALVLALIGPRRLVATLRSRQPRIQWLRSLIMIGNSAVFVLTFKFLPLSDGHAIVGAAPLLVVALSVPMLGEAVGVHRWAAVLVGFAGILVILRPGLGVIDPAVIFPLLGAGLYALYQILTRLAGRTDSVATSLLYSAAIAGGVLSLIGPFDWHPSDLEGWGFLLVIGVLGSLAHMAIVKALQIAPAAALQPFNYMLLVWAAVVGFIAFGEFPDGWTVLGAAVVSGCGLYVFQRERRARQRHSA